MNECVSSTLCGCPGSHLCRRRKDRNLCVHMTFHEQIQASSKQKYKERTCTCSPSLLTPVDESCTGESELVERVNMSFMTTTARAQDETSKSSLVLFTHPHSYWFVTIRWKELHESGNALSTNKICMFRRSPAD